MSLSEQGDVCLPASLWNSSTGLNSRLLTKWRSISLPLDDGEKLQGYVNKVGPPLSCVMTLA